MSDPNNPSRPSGNEPGWLPPQTDAPSDSGAGFAAPTAAYDNAGAPTYTANEAPRGTAGLAIAGLILGILALFISWVPVLGTLAAIVVLIVAYLGLRKTKEGYGGRGMAIGGIVLGILTLAISIVATVALVFLGTKVADIAEKSAVPTSSTAPLAPGQEITQAEYDQIQNGMTIDQVNQIVGSAGQLTNQSKILGQQVDVYTYGGSNGGSATFTFTNGTLNGKVNLNLQ